MFYNVELKKLSMENKNKKGLYLAENKESKRTYFSSYNCIYPSQISIWSEIKITVKWCCYHFQCIKEWQLTIMSTDAWKEEYVWSLAYLNWPIKTGSKLVIWNFIFSPIKSIEAKDIDPNFSNDNDLEFFLEVIWDIYNFNRSLTGSLDLSNWLGLFYLTHAKLLSIIHSLQRRIISWDVLITHENMKSFVEIVNKFIVDHGLFQWWMIEYKYCKYCHWGENYILTVWYSVIWSIAFVNLSHEKNIWNLGLHGLEGEEWKISYSLNNIARLKTWDVITLNNNTKVLIIWNNKYWWGYFDCINFVCWKCKMGQLSKDSSILSSIINISSLKALWKPKFWNVHSWKEFNDEDIKKLVPWSLIVSKSKTKRILLEHNKSWWFLLCFKMDKNWEWLIEKISLYNTDLSWIKRIESI